MASEETPPPEIEKLFDSTDPGDRDRQEQWYKQQYGFATDEDEIGPPTTAAGSAAAGEPEQPADPDLEVRASLEGDAVAAFQEALRQDPEFGGQKFEENMQYAWRANSEMFGDRAQEYSVLADNALSTDERRQAVKLLSKIGRELEKSKRSNRR